MPVGRWGSGDVEVLEAVIAVNTSDDKLVSSEGPWASDVVGCLR